MVSAAISDRGAPWGVLKGWIAGEFGLVVSPRLLHELQTVLAREKFRRYFTYDETTEYVSWLHQEVEVVRDPAQKVVQRAVDADPDDEYLVGLVGALEGTSYLVSVDRYLLDLPGGAVRDGNGRTLARIMTPGEFLRIRAGELGSLLNPQLPERVTAESSAKGATLIRWAIDG